MQCNEMQCKVYKPTESKNYGLNEKKIKENGEKKKTKPNNK